MDSSMHSPCAAAASCNMKCSGGAYERNEVVILAVIPPLSFMLQLAAAAPGLFMPLFMLLLKIILIIIIIIIIII